MGRFLAASEQEDDRVQAVLLFALLCILENISYTRKDGQYFRWDYRSGRRQGKKIFNKGEILAFDKAISDKLHQIVDDLRSGELPDDLFAKVRSKSEVKLHGGSCLDILPELKAKSYDCLITSPPYCNRYDYTRTYALELALLGVSEDGLVKLRQEMLSCTVENRAKDLLALNPKWKAAVAAADNQELLQIILAYLDAQKELDLFNNDGIPRMVRGYFYEMACVIFESARVLKSGAPLMMVNDNGPSARRRSSVPYLLGLQGVHGPRASRHARCGRGHQPRFPFRLFARRDVLGWPSSHTTIAFAMAVTVFTLLSETALGGRAGAGLCGLHRPWRLNDDPLVLGFRGGSHPRHGHRRGGWKKLFAEPEGVIFRPEMSQDLFTAANKSAILQAGMRKSP